MTATRDGLLWHQRLTLPLSAVALGVALALVLLLFCTFGPESRAAPLYVERGDDVGSLPGSWLGITLAPVNAAPPVPVLLGPADEAWITHSNVEFSWSNVGAQWYELHVGGLRTTTTGTSKELTLGDGVYTWTVQAWQGQSRSGFAAPWTVKVDTVPPVAEIVAPANGAVLTTTHLYTVTISGTASDITAGLDRVEVNTGAAWNRAGGTVNWTYAWALPRLDDQPATLNVRSFDKAGNESAWSQVGVTVDTVAPTCSMPIPDRSPWVTSTVIYTWPEPADGSGIVRYQIHISNTGGYVADFYTTEPRYVFTQATQERESYYAQVGALDGRGNWGELGDRSAVIPDLTPPEVYHPYILVEGSYLHAVGATLYYTNTMTFPQPFEVRGYAEDPVSGVDRVCFSAAFGDGPPCDTSGFLPWRSGVPGYAVDPGTTSSGAIVATVYDRAGNTVQPSFGYELDQTPPDSRASSQPYATGSPILVAWTATDAQSGVHSVDLWYRYEGGAWTYAQTQTSGQESFPFVPPGDAPGTYSFVTVARDNVGNLERRATVADTQTVYDKSKPTSEVTWAPTCWNKPGTPITMTWVATPSLSVLSEVRLWYRFDAGAWHSTSVASTGPATSGVFSFALSRGNGRYDFATVARDVLGKSEADPYNSGDRTTRYDTAIESPIGLRCIPPDRPRDNAFTVLWTNPQDLSGIAAAYYKADNAPQDLRDGTHVEGAELEQIDGIRLSGEGLHTVWVWLEDRAGNVRHTSAVTTTCKVEPQHAFLPILFNEWRRRWPWLDWYLYDDYEPNDQPANAYGPLKLGQYQSFIWNADDPDDFYYLAMTSDARIKVLLEDVPANKDYDLYVYQWEGGAYVVADDERAYSNKKGNASETVLFRPEPGRMYWIRVNPYRGPGAPPNNYSQQPYRLTIGYE